jgi:hypothetical protein
VFGDRQELDMGEAHFDAVGDQFVGKLVPGQESPVWLPAPGSGMHLVDGNRLSPRVDLGPVRAVGAVTPVMVEIGRHDRGCRRSEFGAAGIGIGLERKSFAVRTYDLIFVGGTGLHAGGKDLPDPDIGPQAHDMAASIPVVEIADH